MSGKRASLVCSGRMWFNKDETHFLGPNRVSLLEHIAELGSISKAAKGMGMSYKAAWDSVEGMNKLSGEPLVVRVSGGRGGGGTQVTSHGLRIIGLFRSAEESFRKYLLVLNEQLAREFGVSGPPIHAKAPIPNRIEGKVIRVGRAGDAVEVLVSPEAGGEVTVSLPGSLPGTRSLKAGRLVTLIVNPTDVYLLSEGDYTGAFSANALPGEVEQITEGAVDARIQVRLDTGWVITAIQTLGSSRDLGISRGGRVLAVFRPTDVLIALSRTPS